MYDWQICIILSLSVCWCKNCTIHTDGMFYAIMQNINLKCRPKYYFECVCRLNALEYHVLYEGYEPLVS